MRACRSTALLAVLPLTVAVVSARPKPASAEDDAGRLAIADALFEDGKALEAADRWAEACAKYEASLRAVERAGVWGRLAICYERTDRKADAWAAWRRVRATATEAARREVAAQRIAALTPDLAYLRILVPLQLDGLVIERDGRVVAAGELGTEVPVNRGRHTVVVSAPGYQRREETVELADRDRKTVEITALAPDPQPRGEPPIDGGGRDPRRTRRWIGLGASAAGVVVLGTSAAFALSARGQRDRARDLGCSDDLGRCPDVALPSADAAYFRANLATGLAIGGVALVGAGTAVYLLSRDRDRDRRPEGDSDAAAWSIGVTGRGVVVGYGGRL